MLSIYCMVFLELSVTITLLFIKINIKHIEDVTATDDHLLFH